MIPINWKSGGRRDRLGRGGGGGGWGGGGGGRGEGGQCKCVKHNLAFVRIVQ